MHSSKSDRRRLPANSEYPACFDGLKPLNTLTVKTPDGLNVAVQEWGRYDAPGILFIHGYSQSHLSWTKQVLSDLANIFHLVTYDLRGHGASDKPLEARFYNESSRWADEVLAVMDATSLRKAVLVGWSYGGRIVSDYLMKYGDDAIAGVVYVCANTNRDLNAGSPALKVMAGMASKNIETNLEHTRAFVRLCFAKPPTDDEFESIVGFNMLTPPDIRAYMAGRATPYEATLKRLRAPVLVTHGEEDQVVLPTVGRYTLDTVPGAKGSFYPGVGHSPFWEDAQRFNRELAEFVTSANSTSLRVADNSFSDDRRTGNGTPMKQLDSRNRAQKKSARAAKAKPVSVIQRLDDLCETLDLVLPEVTARVAALEHLLREKQLVTRHDLISARAFVRLQEE